MPTKFYQPIFSTRAGLCAFLAIMLVCAAESDAQIRGSLPNRPVASAYPVPVFQFEDGAGRALDLGNFRGRFVLLNLWATWCGPCVEEMPSLDAVQRQFPPQRLAVVAIAEDHNGLSAARYFYQRRGLQGLGLYADPSGQTPALLHAGVLPTTLLIDPDGHELARFEGAVNWTAPDMLAYLKSIVG